MKLFSSAFLSLHVLMLCLTFIKKVEAFTIKVEFFQMHRVYSQTEKDGLPELPLPLPSPSPPSQNKYSDTENDITESFDKTLSVSRPTLNPEEDALLLRTTPLPTIVLELEQIVHILPDNKRDNDSNEHNDTDIEQDSQNFRKDLTHNSIYDIADFDNDTLNIDSTVAYEENSTLSYFDVELNGANKTERLSLKIFRKMFDPQRVDLVYFLGGAAVVVSLAGALLLTKKLLNRTA